ncbi:hypothetical protein GVAV_000379 [Gurleya vavrai]
MKNMILSYIIFAYSSSLNSVQDPNEKKLSFIRHIISNTKGKQLIRNPVIKRNRITSSLLIDNLDKDKATSSRFFTKIYDFEHKDFEIQLDLLYPSIVKHNWLYKTTIPFDCITYYLKLQSIIFDSYIAEQDKKIRHYELREKFTAWYNEDADVQRKNGKITEEQVYRDYETQNNSNTVKYEVFWKNNIGFKDYINKKPQINQSSNFSENLPSKSFLLCKIDGKSFFKYHLYEKYTFKDEFDYVKTLIEKHMLDDEYDFEQKKNQYLSSVVNEAIQNKRKLEQTIDKQTELITENKKKIKNTCGLQDIPVQTNIDHQKNFFGVSEKQLQTKKSNPIEEINNNKAHEVSENAFNNSKNNAEIFDLFKKIANFMKFYSFNLVAIENYFIDDGKNYIDYLFMFYIIDVKFIQLILSKNITNITNLTDSDIYELFEFFKVYFLLLIDPNTGKIKTLIEVNSLVKNTARVLNSGENYSLIVGIKNLYESRRNEILYFKYKITS